MINFYKYQGAGNDFIMIDNRTKMISQQNKIALAIHNCERRFGVGSDGMIFIEPHNDLDFVMDFYNPDGSQSFCGNGSRCAVAFAKKIGVFYGESCRFLAIDGEHHAEITNDGYKVSMQNVSEISRIDNDYFIDTGSPHYIKYVDNITDWNLIEFGQKIRYSRKYEPGGTNVNLVEIVSKNEIKVRTYERGVEAETFACGTGATACALSYANKLDELEGIIDISVKGGDLKVYFSKSKAVYTNIWLEGPAELVFEGILM